MKKVDKSKARRFDGLTNFDITLNDGVDPVVKKRRVPFSELDEVIAELKKKMR